MRRAACALLLLLAACGHQPVVSGPDACRLPTDDGEWPVSTPRDEGFDSPQLCEVLRSVSDGPANIHALLVERHGRLVAELYRSGPDLPLSQWYGLPRPWAPDVVFDANTLHDVRSASKSITALVYGIELGKGRVPAMETPVLKVYPDLGELPGPGHDAITVAHLMTMSSGLHWQEWGRSLFSSDETLLYWKRQTVRYLMDRPVVSTPGARFNYNGGSTQALADILMVHTGQSVAELARQDLFEPLGIRHWSWTEDWHDRPLAFAGLRLRPRDMLKLGRLVNARGAWQGRQVVPAAWVERSVRAQLPTGITLFSLDQAPAGYGHQWWTGHVPWHGRDLEWASAIGNGGQRIFVLPALDLTVVMTAGDYGAAGIHQAQGALLSRIVAAVLP